MQPSEIRILVCDDSIMIQKKMESLLSAKGYTQIFSAKDGDAAVEAYKAYRPHIVFMDIVMPGKSGIEALTEIMTLDPKAKVVMASSIGTQNNLKEAIEKGACSFLQKPIDDAQVMTVIKAVVG